MKRIGMFLPALLLVALLRFPAAAAEPKVVVSLAPLQALAGAVMQGVAEPVLLLPGGASPHSYALKPSQMQTLQQADLVFWVGPGLETFLGRSLTALPESVQVVSLSKLPGLNLLPVRSGGVWALEGTDPGHDHDHRHGADAVDLHLWLSTGRAQTLAEEICHRLVLLDPEHAARYRANLERFIKELVQLRSHLHDQLAPLRDRPYLVFHDAYRYFEEEFDLHPVGAVSLSPERPPGARRLRELQGEIRQRQVRCIFREPQFPPRLVEMLTAGTGAREGVLDPLGTGLPPGAEGYLTLMRRLAEGLRECLE